MIDLITNISSLISGIMVIVAFLGVLIKPIRKKIETWLRNTTNAEELTNTMKAHTKPVLQRYQSCIPRQVPRFAL